MPSGSSAFQVSGIRQHRGRCQHLLFQHHLSERREFTITASTIDAPLLQDSYGPISIDSTGPFLDIITPERGSWSTSASDSISGTVSDDWSGVFSLAVNSASVIPDSNGDFSTGLTHSWGVNTMRNRRRGQRWQCVRRCTGCALRGLPGAGREHSRWHQRLHRLQRGRAD